MNKPCLSTHLFGPFEASLDGQALKFRSDKIRALLAYLLVEANTAHRRESLAALLWGEQPEEAARTNLRQALLQLKKSLAPLLAGEPAAPPFVEITPKTVRLNLEPQYGQVDVVAFAAGQAGCPRHPHLALAGCGDCLEQLRQAIALYRGDFLTGLTLPGAPAFDEWRVQRQEQYHRQAIAALETLIEGSLAGPDYPQAEIYLRRLLTLEPWREATHRQLMLVLAQSGRTAAALAHFETCCRTLLAELGVEPAAETTTLAERIRTGELSRGAEEPGSRGEIFSSAPPPPHTLAPLHHWGDAPDVSRFYGRETEMAQLTRWLTQDGCRLVTISGMGGMGKTTLAARAAKKVAGQFEAIFWRSLLNAPALNRVLRAGLQFLSQQTLNQWPDAPDEQLDLLFDSLRRQRCLLILDNLESLLQSGRAGYFKPGYEAYDLLLRRAGQTEHQSCLLLTSREKPLRVARLEGETPLVCSLSLAGLDASAGQKILGNGPTQSAEALVRRYSGNPLALKLAGRAIQELFAGDSAAFLNHEAAIFDDIRAVLDQQFQRLSPLEQELLLWLAVEREPASVQALADNLARPVSKRAVLEALGSLRRRSLVEQRPGPHPAFGLSNVVIEYLTDTLIEQVTQELEREQLDLFNRLALLKAQAKDYVRQSQTRLIAQPIADSLAAGWGAAGAAAKLRRLLDKWRGVSPPPGYAAGNILNLLRRLGADVRGYDFSGLTVWQAYLRDMALPQVDFSGADLSHSAFTDTFGMIHALAFSPDGRLLAAGTENGDIYLWRLPGGQLAQIFAGHSGEVKELAFSPDGQTLASGSQDGTIYLWDSQTGQPRYQLKHPAIVHSVAFSPDGAWLASSSGDHLVRLWATGDGQLSRTLSGHTNEVISVAFSPDGQTIASGGFDQTVRLWDAGTGQLRHTLQEHTLTVSSVTFSPDGQIVASGSPDQTVRLWDVQTGQMYHQHLEHAHAIWSIAFSPDGQTIACGSFGQAICLWDIQTGQTHYFLHEQNATAWRVAFSPDGQTLASGSADQTIQLWAVRQGRLYRTLQGYTGGVLALALSADGQTLVSGHADQRVRRWHTPTGQCNQIWHDHSRMVQAVAISADGQTIASGSTDRTICLWQGGQLRYTLHGHRAAIWGLALSPNGQTLASASEDQTVRLWDVETGRCVEVLHGHTHLVLAVAFSPDGRFLASGSLDRTLCLWDAQTGAVRQVWPGQEEAVCTVAFSPDGQHLASAGETRTVFVRDVADGQITHTFPGHTSRVWCVAFSPDGRRLASGGDDQVIRLWDVAGGELIRTLPGHTNRVWAVCFSPTGSTLISGSADGTIKVWDVNTGDCRHTWRSEGPYAGMNITSATGLTAAHKTALKALGAVEANHHL